MSYDLTQKLNLINDNNYDDDITANIEPNHFIAVTANVMTPGGTEREMTVQIMELDGLPGGEVHTNSGLFVRQEGENSVKAILLDTNGQEVDSNVTNYS